MGMFYPFIKPGLFLIGRETYWGVETFQICCGLDDKCPLQAHAVVLFVEVVEPFRHGSLLGKVAPEEVLQILLHFHSLLPDNIYDVTT